MKSFGIPYASQTKIGHRCPFCKEDIVEERKDFESFDTTNLQKHYETKHPEKL